MTADINTIRHARVLLPCLMAGFLVFFLLQQSIALGAAAALILGCAGLVFRWPEIGTLAALFAIYSNLAVLGMRSQSAIQTTAGSPEQNSRIDVVLAVLALLLCAPLIYYFVVRKQHLIFDRGFILMLAFFAALLLSSFFARDKKLVEWELWDFLLEGLLLYFLLVNVVREFSALRRAVWTLLLAGSLMGGLSLIQKLSHSENNFYGGLAQTVAEISTTPSGREVIGKVRTAGPIGESNRYALVLVVLLPLAALCFRTERSLILRLAAAAAAGLISAGILLTYSRGAIVTGVIVAGLMVATRLLKLRYACLAALGIGFFVTIWEPDVVARMASLERLSSLFGNTHAAYQTPDTSAMRRYVESAAAWRTFLDHPLLGVGPGNFAAYYSQGYGNRVGLIEQTKKYRGHDLYLETLAETGVVGLISFVAILAAVMYGLWRERRHWMQIGPELAHTATAFLFSLAAFAIGATFVHLSYQRYFWLLLAVSSAALRIIHSYRAETPPARELPLPEEEAA